MFKNLTNKELIQILKQQSSIENSQFLDEVIEVNIDDIELEKSEDESNYEANLELLQEIEKELDSPILLKNTERELIARSRIGQPTFKKSLLKRNSKCRLCGVTDRRFLIASHIKLWRKSNDIERLDVNNGLLLCPNHDALFDKGYISFNDNGSIFISDSLDQDKRMSYSTVKKQQKTLILRNTLTNIKQRLNSV
jgi:putative restriction endonuclease